VYLIPRAVLENLVHAFPVEACQLIESARTTRGRLDPSGLPSEAGCRCLQGFVVNRLKRSMGLALNLSRCPATR